MNAVESRNRSGGSKLTETQEKFIIKTSESHPLPVSWVLVHPSGGKLGLCHCPGKKVTRDRIKHERDLAIDFLHLKQNHGVSVLVCLLNNAELSSFHVRDYHSQAQQHGFKVIQYPIIEMAAPDDFVKAAQVVEEITTLLEQGCILAMHCRGGVGRAGLMAACTLLRTSQASSAEEAIKLVRWRRCPQAVETKRQEDFIHTYGKHLATTALLSRQESDFDEPQANMTSTVAS